MNGRRRASFSAAIFLSAAVAAAQEAIVPPRLLEDPGASYPRQALAEHFYERVQVVLVLELDATGRLRTAVVEKRRGHGFDEAAIEAAWRLRFEPAQRGGSPVASRIRYRYAFEPPQLTPATPVVQASPAVPVAKKDDSVEEVTVRGTQRHPTAASYTRAEVRQIPGAFGDPFRAIDTLPGVAPMVSGLPFFYLRGAPPGNAGYFLDGVRVPYLYHVGAGPSVVQPGTVERVDVYPGGYPAEFGRFAGGIVSAETTAPRPELHGEGNLRLFDVGAMVETGFADGRGTALLGGRYSYTAALLSLAAPQIQLDYRDFQARVSYDVSPDDRVSVFGFGAYDLLKKDGKIEFGSEFYRADLRHEHRLARGNIRTAVTLGYDRTSAALFEPDDRRNLTDRSIAVRTEIEEQLRHDVVIRAGANSTLDAYRPEGASYADPDSVQTRQFAPTYARRLDHATGAWASVVLDPTPAIEIVTGLRTDLYGSGGTTALGIDPRLAARLAISKHVRLVPAIGLAHQPPSFLVPLPGIAPPLGSGLQTSLQSSGGVEIDLGDATTAGSTLFYSAFFDMTDAFATSGRDPNKSLDIRSKGSAYGAELFLRRRLTKRLGGFLSYTLSRSLRSVGGHAFLSAFDRTHVANAAIVCDLGRGWKAGSRFLFYTGTPRWNPDSDSGPIVSGTSGVPREPAFYRLDLRLEKRWSLRGTAWISFVAEFLNATLNKETWAGGEKIGPIAVPSLGVEAGF